MNDNPYADLNASSNVPKPKTRSGLRFFIDLLTVFALIAVVASILAAFMLPSSRVARPAARRSQCKNNLKQIALALHHYEQKWDALPPAYTVDADGNPLHSWRTLILPYLDQQALYESIDLSKAWDDPANAEAFQKVLPVYLCPSAAAYHAETHTTYLAVVALGGCFRPGEPRPLSEITDNHGETLMVVEMPPEYAVPWMSPWDANETLLLGFGSESKLAHSGGFNAAFVDGSAHFVTANSSSADRRNWISITGDSD